jgi:hypothetical protein
LRAKLDRKCFRFGAEFFPENNPVFGKGKENGPQMHGDFDNFEYWKPEFYWNGSEAAPGTDCN